MTTFETIWTNGVYALGFISMVCGLGYISQKMGDKCR